MTSGVVRTAYSARAAEYISLFDSISSTHPVDRELVLSWARGLSGKVIDAGCGPGQWTAFLHSGGVAIQGVDLVPEFIETAKQNCREAQFAVGSIEQLPTPDHSLAGILAWYSLIHTPPAGISQVLDEFSRCLKPGGSLLIGFFDGPAGESFPHAVTPAYFWSVEEMSARLQDAGFAVIGTHSRADPGVRPHAAIIAQRLITPSRVG
ncbi:Methyltransferase domain-containing protein [Arthrobacter sp. yr096]|uniref:class I SAM-dependent methyltransferase n=1 Tax=Arthrobacter sp. yr096 TaxID=1761750 RepID=UPI0008B66CA5|nr:class I SAM-dependent methyltransferase [Arthrobacter sp. yr096]SEJ51385.1 Methyltransferase domain-containing protein [Arthrobacter sp. yr096]